MVRSLATTSALTLVVGPGASAEAGLPSWRRLLHDLLDRAAHDRLGLEDVAVRDAWIEEILRGESPLGAAAVAEALAAPDLAAWVPEALYGADPTAYQPGPIARQVAELRRSFGSGLNVLTTNYDDLIEQSLEDADLDVTAVPFTGPWVAVRAFTRGAALGEPRDVYASRWRYIRGLPLVTDDRLPVGVITISTMRDAEQTLLNRMPGSVKATFDDALRQAALDILGSAFPVT